MDDPLTREALYELVWSEPMLKIAERFNVSSSYMARICKLFDVPKPERGYWARVAAGNPPKKRPPLPDAPPDASFEARVGGYTIRVAPRLPCLPEGKHRRRRAAKRELPKIHTLVSGVKELFVTGRQTDIGYLKPSKPLLVDMVVTKSGLEKALALGNELFLALERRGHKVNINPRGTSYCRAEVDERTVSTKRPPYYQSDLWRPQRCTVAHVDGVPIGLTIIEMSEEAKARHVNGKYIREKDYVPKRSDGYTWPTNHEFPTGRLRLQAYANYGVAKWVRRWEEPDKHDLNSRVKAIVRELEQAVPEIIRLVEDGQRRAERELQEWEAQREQWRREEEERRASQARKESREELIQIVNAWGKANRIEQFFKDAEQRADGLGDDERNHLLERLKLAREMVGSVDALDHFMEWVAPEERLKAICIPASVI